MRVLHVFHHIFHYHCGYRTRCEHILRFQRTHGIEPVVVTSSDHEHGPRVVDMAGTYVTRQTPSYKGSALAGLREWGLVTSLQRQVEATIEELRPEVVHAHSPVLVAWPALRAARRFRLPFVYEVRDLWENASVDLGKFAPDSWRYRVARSLDTRVLQAADAVVVLGHGMRRELHARGVRLEKIHVVGNGVDAGALASHDAARTRARARWNLGGDSTIGYVGTFQPYEGLSLLLDALPAIRAAMPVRVVIAGDGREEDALRAQAHRLGVAEIVTFAGRLPHHEAAQVYAASDLMVYPRILTRTTALTTPLKPLEAMALKTPVLASNVPGLAELVEDGRTGWLFRAGDVSHLAARCVEVLTQPAARQSVVDEAHKWVIEARQWTDQVARYGTIYDALAAPPEARLCA